MNDTTHLPTRGMQPSPKFQDIGTAAIEREMAA